MDVRRECTYGKGENYEIRQITGNTCGAISISYLLSKAGKAKDENEVNRIYERVRFGDKTYGIDATYCNPVKMIKEIMSNVNGEAEFYCGNNPGFINISATMERAGELNNIRGFGKESVHKEAYNLENLKSNEYFIEILVSPAPETSAVKMHYIFVYKNGSDIMGVNPHRGKDEAYRKAVAGGLDGTDTSWQSSGAGILIRL